jgi:hypothetical protein
MAQNSESLTNYEGFKSIDISPVRREIRCSVDDEGLNIIIQKTRKETVIILEKGSKRMRMCIDSFEKMCDLKISTLLLKSFLEGNNDILTTGGDAIDKQLGVPEGR